MKKNLISTSILTLALVMGATGINAKKKKPEVVNQPVKTLTEADVTYRQSGGNYHCYPWLNETPPTLTPAPEGYKPFHIEHYGRHGSRWLIGYKQYDRAYEILNKADKAGKLTPLGKRTFEAVKQIREDVQKREGELSDNGALQHKGIGKRMATNYPEVFTPETNIDAKSTVIIRSILSMFNGLNGIQAVVPEINVKTDASRATMWYMDYDDTVAYDLRKTPEVVAAQKAFNKRHANKGEYLKKLINDPEYARDSISDKLFPSLFSVLINAQSHSTQPWLAEEVFTPEEVQEQWAVRNVNWFLRSGNSKLTNNRVPFSQANVLNNIIESADTAMNSTTPSVNLRYGHDTIVMPLSCLLELNNFGEEINDLEMVAESGWHEYLAVPMAGNIQMIFYRKPGTTGTDDVLVKVLLNEREMTLPLDRENGPYYKWNDFRKYYMDKIKDYTTPNP
ncbi:MAG: histidine-type phosphatase, partial [Muribaculaceae bacterium]|nr:histidine-type phosphatase [Muribaculaceae bacterium]